MSAFAAETPGPYSALDQPDCDHHGKGALNMYKIVISGLSPLALLLLTTLSTPAAAEASVEAVVAACDRMADQNPGSCDYKIEGNELRGCTKNVCFRCPADGKRLCFAVSQPGTVGDVEVNPE
jgi:hypothetical protein